IRARVLMPAELALHDSNPKTMVVYMKNYKILVISGNRSCCAVHVYYCERWIQCFLDVSNGIVVVLCSVIGHKASVLHVLAIAARDNQGFASNPAGIWRRKKNDGRREVAWLPNPSQRSL